MQRIQTFEQYAYPEVTQTMLDDAAIPIEAFIVDETEDVMGRTENTAFVTGNGVLRPRGFADYASAAVTTNDATRSWGVLQYVASGAAGAFSGTDKLITMMSKLNPNYRQGAVWTMNRSTEATVRQLKDGDGRYLVGFGDLRDSPFNFSLLGTEIVNLEDMADIASNSYSVAYGNFKRGYLIIDRTGFRILRDPYTNKPYVGFYITKRVGGDVRNFDAIKLMKFAAS
jgi:HK97 family phage major capsid protein